MAITSKKIINLIRLYIIFTALTLILSTLGCSKPSPLALQGHGVLLRKTKIVWSRDFGPENAGHFRSLAIHDFNNDGNLDIIGGSYEPGAIFLWYGDGQGHWERIQRFKIKADISSMAAGDVNGDGWFDLVSSSLGDTKGIQVWINKNGTFSDAQPVTEKELFDGLRVSDINNDGKLDIVAANSTEVSKGGIQIWLGDGEGNFINETGPTRYGIYRDIEACDVNNDGIMDIIGAGWSFEGGALRVWLGVGDGRWSDLPIIEKGSFWGVSVTDVNKDSYLDIITASNFDGVKIFYGDGQGNFPRKDVLAKTGSFWGVKATDLNRDGIIDVVVATCNDDNGLVIWYRRQYQNNITEDTNGSDTTANSEDREQINNWIAQDEGLPKKGFYFDLCLADFNQDGRPDLAASCFGEGIKVWLREIKDLPPKKPKKEKIKVKDIKPEQELMGKEEKKEERLAQKDKLLVPIFYIPVFFEFDKAELTPQAKLILSNIVEFLKKVEHTMVTVQGYRDNTRNTTEESDNDRKNLAQIRAKTVTQYLTNGSILQERIQLIDAPKEKGNAFSIDDPTGDDASAPERADNKIGITILYKEVESDEEKTLDTKEPDIKKLTGFKSEAKEHLHEIMEDNNDYPFIEKGDVVPVATYKVFKVINNISEYRIGPGDGLEIRIWAGVKENHYTTSVSPQGTISFVYIKDFDIQGLTETEADIKLMEQLEHFIKKPMVKIRVISKVAHSASIFGAIGTAGNKGPGTYNLNGRERLTQFLSRVGGHLPESDLTHVQLIRNNKTYFVNIYDALFKGDHRQDVIIDADDVIFVPSKAEIQKRVFVMGEVQNPGIITYDSTISLLETITRAVPTFYSKTKDIVVIRGDETKPEAIKISFDDIIRKGDFRKNITLQNGDIVYVSTNKIGDIRDLLRTIYPVLSIPRLPMDIYGSFVVPKWEGFPLRKNVSPPGTYYWY